MDIQHHWEYFLAIEDDLLRTTRFVHFSKDNFKTYSIEFGKIILASGSEFDVVAKRLCKNISSCNKADNIRDYYGVITDHYETFTATTVKIVRFEIVLTPWENWKCDTSPDWWRSYNNVKHRRDAHFSEANLETALNSVAGLLCGLKCLFTFNQKEARLWPLTQLMDTQNNQISWDGSIQHVFNAPRD